MRLLLHLPHSLVRILCIPPYIAGHCWPFLARYMPLLCLISFTPALPSCLFCISAQPAGHPLTTQPTAFMWASWPRLLPVCPCQPPHHSPQPLKYTPDHPEITADTASGSQAGIKALHQIATTMTVPTLATLTTLLPLFSVFQLVALACESSHWVPSFCFCFSQCLRVYPLVFILVVVSCLFNYHSHPFSLIFSLFFPPRFCIRHFIHHSFTYSSFIIHSFIHLPN
mgnify:CR=1 FL=1